MISTASLLAAIGSAIGGHVLSLVVDGFCASVAAKRKRGPSTQEYQALVDELVKKKESSA